MGKGLEFQDFRLNEDFKNLTSFKKMTTFMSILIFQKKVKCKNVNNLFYLSLLKYKSDKQHL